MKFKEVIQPCTHNLWGFIKNAVGMLSYICIGSNGDPEQTVTPHTFPLNAVVTCKTPTTAHPGWHTLKKNLGYCARYFVISLSPFPSSSSFLVNILLPFVSA
jgi:hypothetical protein